MIDSVIRVFIGYDAVESVAWHTMVQSLVAHSSRPVAIVPVHLPHLQGLYTRPRHPRQSNAFSISRFLVPHLCGHQGMALFFDCDMLLRTDVATIFDAAQRDPGRAVYVVQHDYQPRNDIKYLGTVQYRYPRKNWSSVVLWNCAHPSNQQVTAGFVNNADPVDLHRFAWLRDDEIGALDVRWNWLVGEYDDPPPDVKNVHWTVGGPYFEEYANADFANEWREQHAQANHCEQKGKRR